MTVNHRLGSFTRVAICWCRCLLVCQNELLAVGSTGRTREGGVDDSTESSHVLIPRDASHFSKIL